MRTELDEAKRALKGKVSTAEYYRAEMEKLQYAVLEKEQALEEALQQQENQQQRQDRQADAALKDALIERLQRDYVPKERVESLQLDLEAVEKDRDEYVDLMEELRVEYEKEVEKSTRLANKEQECSALRHTIDELETKLVSAEAMELVLNGRLYEKELAMQTLATTLKQREEEKEAETEKEKVAHAQELHQQRRQSLPQPSPTLSCKVDVQTEVTAF